jgi:hypothetical protein
MNFAFARITSPDGYVSEYVVGEAMIPVYADEAIANGWSINFQPISVLDAVLLDVRLIRNREIFLAAAAEMWDQVADDNEDLVDYTEAADVESEVTNRNTCQCENCTCVQYENDLADRF